MSNAFDSFAARLSAVEKRVRWPGATQAVLQSGSLTLADDFEWLEVIELPIDPGSWIVMAGAVVTRAYSGGGYTLEVKVNTSGIYAVQPNETRREGLQDVTSPTTTDTLPVQGLAYLPEATTLILEVRYFSSIAVPDASVLDSYLIAYPF